VTRHPICFDATGTLIELNEGVGEVYHRVALEHGIDLPAWRLEDAFLRILRRAPARGVEGETVAARRQSEVDWWFERVRETFQATDNTARFSDFPAFATALFDTYRSADAWRLRSGAARMLATLRDREWPMAVVSNFDHRLPKILEALDISSFFKLVVVPSNSGSAKPERAVFERVGRAFGTPLENLLYVGDDAKEVLDAIAALGLRVFDVRKIADLEDFPDLAATAATLPPR
jgi:putative hydrolase of the HAD superfamily